MEKHAQAKLYKEDRDEFEKHCHQRSLVESIYWGLKTVFGNHLSSRRREVQRRDLMCRVIAYNIDRANLTTIESERS